MDFNFGSNPTFALGYRKIKDTKAGLQSLLKDLAKSDDFTQQKLLKEAQGLLKEVSGVSKKDLYTGSFSRVAGLESQFATLQKNMGLAKAGLGQFTKEKFIRTQLREQFNILSDTPGAAQTIMSNRSAIGY